MPRRALSNPQVPAKSSRPKSPGISLVPPVDHQEIALRGNRADHVDRFFTLSLDLLCICSADGYFKLLNPAWTTVLGYETDELLGQPFARFMHPDDMEATTAEIVKLMGGAMTVDFENRYRCKNGSYRSLLWTVAPLPEQGLMYAVARDITDRKQTDAKFEALLEAAPDAIVGLDQGGVIRMVNRQTELLFRYERAELIGMAIGTLVPEGFRAAHPAHRSEYFANPMTRAMGTGLELTGRRREGTEFPVDISLSSIETEEGALVIAAVRDVTDRKQAAANARSLVEAEDLVRVVLASASIGIGLAGLDGSFRVVNASMCELLGHDQEWFLGHHLRDIAHPEDLAVAMPEKARYQAGTLDKMASEVRLLRADGETVWVRRVTVLLRDGEGEPSLLMVQFEDITAEHEAHETLTFQAFHDPLTGLHNRAWILDILQVDLPAAQRSGTSVGVMFVDLDNFKVVNDSLGHAAGDEVLAAVAHRMEADLRPGDRIGRFGGDEFVVVVQDVHHGLEVERCAERVSASITTDLQVQGHRIVPAASIGIAVSTPSSTADSLLRDADSALFRAKAAGRGRWQFFDAAMHAHAVARLTLEDQLRDAISRGEFVVHYQPIVALADARVVGHEALVRWAHPTRGLLDPDDFMDVAEDTGLITEIGPQVLDQVCAMLAQRPELPGSVSVNVSAVQLAALNWLKGVRETLTRHRVDPARIVIEITETAVLGLVDSAKVALASLRRLGVGIHVDDFGTGYSSISVLRDLPVTGVKLDLRFVHDLTTGDSQANALAHGLSGLVKGMHLTGIAEGVETPMQAEILAAQGWEHGQGYYFGRPDPVPQVDLRDP